MDQSGLEDASPVVAGCRLDPTRQAVEQPCVEASGEPDRTWRERFARVCREVGTWPLPGRGNTFGRFELLARFSAEDVVLGRLLEAHADALAILHELAADVDLLPASDMARCWGVWAAGPPDGVVASRHGDQWRVSGTKHWCSGAGLLTHALVDAASADGQRLFAVELAHPGVAPAPPDWVGVGMRRADTRRVDLLDVPARAIGNPGDYLSRPGFWAGAVGVAACWHGGTVAIARTLRSAVEQKADAHALVHLGAVYAVLVENRSMLREAACRIDARPDADFAVMARAVRFTIERNGSAVIDRLGRALGPRPLAYDRAHAQAVSDLQVYMRQSHAERDLELLGQDLLDGRASWPT